MTVPRNVNRLRGAKALGRAPGTVTAVTLHDWRVTGAAQTRADLVASIVNKQFPTAGSRAALLREARELAHPRAGALVTIQSWVPEGARSNTERRLARALAKLSIIVVLNYRIGPYRFDLVHVGARLFIEFDSKHFHADIRAFRSDRARRNIAVRKDWGFLRYHGYRHRSALRCGGRGDGRHHPRADERAAGRVRLGSDTKLGALRRPALAGREVHCA